jgi:flagellar protein FlaG
MALDVSHITIVSPPYEALRAIGSNGEARPAPEYKPAALTQSQLEGVMEDLENVSATFNRRLSFSINEKLGQVVVKVIDTNTDTVIKELPPEELQHVHERIREVIGLLLDEQA